MYSGVQIQADIVPLQAPDVYEFISVLLPKLRNQDSGGYWRVLRETLSIVYTKSYCGGGEDRFRTCN